MRDEARGSEATENIGPSVSEYRGSEAADPGFKTLTLTLFIEQMETTLLVYVQPLGKICERE